jgi:hypothetical protein
MCHVGRFTEIKTGVNNFSLKREREILGNIKKYERMILG